MDSSREEMRTYLKDNISCEEIHKNTGAGQTVFHLNIPTVMPVPLMINSGGYQGLRSQWNQFWGDNMARNN